MRHPDGYWYGAQVLINPRKPDIPNSRVIEAFGHLTEKEYFALKLRGDAALHDALLELWSATL